MRHCVKGVNSYEGEELGVSILQQVRARRDVAVWVKKGRCGSRVERLDIDNLEAAL